MCSYPSRLKRLSGKASSMHLVSCRHSTSGRTDLRNLATRSMRSRTELIFHVVRESAIGARGSVQEKEYILSVGPGVRVAKDGVEPYDRPNERRIGARVAG